MKVKIGNKIIDSNDQPVMVIFDEGEKEMISTMEVAAIKYCSYPEGLTISEVVEFMKIEEEDPNQLTMAIDNDVVIVNSIQVGD